MSKHKQIEKNLQLSEKLMNYLADHPAESPTKKFGSVSFVILTKSDTELNRLNIQLIESLLSEGKKVVKALQTSDKNNPWTFSLAA